MDYKDISQEIESVGGSYHFSKPPQLILRTQELLQQLWQWLLEFLESLNLKSPGPVDSRPMSGLLQAIVIIAGVVAFIVILYLLWNRLRSKQEKEKSLLRGASEVEKIPDFQRLKEEAERFAQEGNFRSACRTLYLALLQLLHEKEIAIFAPAKTNYEYCYLLAAYPSLVQSFREMAFLVELVWFGNKEAAGEDYAQSLELLTAIERQVDNLVDKGQAVTAKQVLPP